MSKKGDFLRGLGILVIAVLVLTIKVFLILAALPLTLLYRLTKWQFLKKWLGRIEELLGPGSDPDNDPENQ